MESRAQSAYNQNEWDHYASKESLRTLREEIQNHYATKHYVIAAATVPSLLAIIGIAWTLLRVLPNLIK